MAMVIYIKKMNFQVSSQFTADCASEYYENNNYVLHDRHYFAHCNNNITSLSKITIYGSEIPTNPCLLSLGAYSSYDFATRLMQLFFLSIILISHYKLGE
jgi:hypothetical protein